MKPNLNLSLGGKKSAPKAAVGFLQLNLLPDVKKQLLKVRRERNMVISISIVAAIASVAVLVVISGILGSLKVYEAVTRNSIKSSEKTIQASQENDELDKYLTVQNQLVQIKGLKGKQQIYSRLLGYLVALNPAKPNNVMLNSVTVGNTSDSGATTDASTGVTMTIEGRIADFPALDVYKTTLGSAKLKYTEITDEDEESPDSSSNSDAKNDNSDGKKDDNSKSVKLFSNVTVQEQALSSGGSNNEGGVSFTIQVTFDPIAFSSTIENPIVEVPNETTSDSSRNAPATGGDSTEMFHTIENNGSSNSNSQTSSDSSSSSSQSSETNGTDNTTSGNGGSDE